MDNSKAVAIITDEAVQAALTADLGKDAKLDSWKNLPFTKKGDNYASFVTGIHVNYTKGEKKEKSSYVVKINPCRPQFSPDMPDFAAMLFEKEGKFYLDLLPELNLIMTQSGQKLLPFPRCYYAQYAKDMEMIIFEDLRLKDFKMTDRRKGMDLQHAILVMKGLGRLHAASIIMQNKKSLNDFKEQYPWLFEELLSGKMLNLYMTPSISTAKEMLAKVGGHEKAIKWLDNLLPNIEDLFLKNLAFSKQFNVICHGDCWNNILFRYNDSGLPVEVMLFDIQVNKMASLATDLNYFMFVSLTGPIRKPNADRLLTDYYDSLRYNDSVLPVEVMLLDIQVNKMASLATDLNYFMFASLTGPIRKPNVDRLLTDYNASLSSVIERCSQVIPFTKDELVKEYKSKNDHGLIFGTVIVPPIVMDTEGEDMPYMENITAENFEQFQQDWQKKKVMEGLDTNPVCKPRFVSMFNDMLEEGLFNNSMSNNGIFKNWIFFLLFYF